MNCTTKQVRKALSMHRNVPDHSVHTIGRLCAVEVHAPFSCCGRNQACGREIARVLTSHLILLPLLFGVFHAQRLQSATSRVYLLSTSWMLSGRQARCRKLGRRTLFPGTMQCDFAGLAVGLARKTTCMVFLTMSASVGCQHDRQFGKRNA